jgi:hypothetical protein
MLECMRKIEGLDELPCILQNLLSFGSFVVAWNDAKYETDSGCEIWVNASELIE